MSEGSDSAWIASALEAWSSRVGLRYFPWRGFRDGYRVATTEVLLQQTRAAAVVPVLRKFHSRWPDWRSLASAPVADLEAMIAPIGLHRRRARALLAMAQAVGERGRLPANRVELEAMPAIGQYVASALLAQCHDRPEAMFDTNALRVFSRFAGGRTHSDYRHDKVLQELAVGVVRAGHPREMNFAILDLGALVCKPRAPLCSSCPLAERCQRWGVS